MDAKDLEVKALQSERSTHVKERGTINRRITAEETLLEKSRGKLHEVIQKAKVELEGLASTLVEPRRA